MPTFFERASTGRMHREWRRRIQNCGSAISVAALCIYCEALERLGVKKHCAQGIVLTCPHVWQDMQSGTATIDCLVTSKHEPESVCGPDGFHSFGLLRYLCKTVEATLRDEVLNDSPSELGDQTKPFCGKCFELFKETVGPYDSP